jgi:hypothetical protein
MIQRIQTVYLILAGLASSLLLFFFPLAFYYSDTVSLKFRITGIENLTPLSDPVTINPILIYLLVFLAVAAGLLAVATISKYRNRPLQLKLLRISFLVEIVKLIFLFVVIDFIRKSTGAELDYGTGMFLPVIGLLFFILAHRGVQADERRVKSADRLR